MATSPRALESTLSCLMPFLLAQPRSEIPVHGLFFLRAMASREGDKCQAKLDSERLET